ncbi:mitochondrial E3 ubiquitin protein ligase 1 [Diabrotica undecimpunctata]|uniref:mitochondrial E3 ubiquitin protein ligase 1 n=1 Tax=Diabrotica undecimpunctata TaxID=50387 RepID=UPI003B637166
MDYLAESIALGVDSIILAVCIRQYYKKKNAMALIQGAPYLEINKDLKEIVETHPDHKLSYVAIRGTVKALGNPIVSNANPTVTGVVQVLKIKEHVIQRSTAGFWADSERVIQEVHNVMPFALETRGIQIEICDPLGAEVLDMDVISDNFHPTVPSVIDHIWSFFAGIRQRGIQSTEKMLRTGSVITGIGELVAEKDGNLKLQPPTEGGPFYLTNMGVVSLLKKLNSSKSNYRIMCIVFGSIGIVISGFIVKKYLRIKAEKESQEQQRSQLELSRKERRRKIRDEDLNENQICVVCKENPKEIILLPCGHVCLCEDCALGINEFCPICRSHIEKKNVAYVA